MIERLGNRRYGEIVEDITLSELCRIGGFHAEWVIELVDHGVLEPMGRDTDSWRFVGASVSTATKAWRLHRDLGVNLPGIALAIGLMEERDRLRRRLGRHDPFA
ncbi:hypothetical protein G5B40_01315 [Pikeienuella piscinae]|uniref:MerR family transcriptional regulator n=1 Tax=Pikeienuella piscinae TaxID=2748098 RepID=A0A7L5BX81_9RHOB|nr:chaperone modulator CbpM [Pikeienuella piscinae]QIE54199.1 hypothetical protein G5B40_01315 [Pikeienuella piscinae]